MSKKRDSTHAFIDLMTSLAIIFILLLVAILNNAATQGQETLKDLKSEVSEEIKPLGLTLADDPDDPNTEIVRLDQKKVKFEYRKADLTDQGVTFVSQLFLNLTPKLCDPEFAGKIDSVIIEGHTDTYGEGTLMGDLNNVDLSQDRAFAVMKQAFLALDAKGMTKEEDGLRSMISAVGLGARNPLPHQPASANRRVEIKIRFKPVVVQADAATVKAD